MDHKRLCSIEGRVVAGDGDAGVADAAVMIQTSDQPHNDIALLTDGHGGFRFADLLPGSYTLAAHAPDGTRGTETVDVAPGRVARVTIRTTA